MNTEIQVGVIGTGRMGQRHAHNLTHQVVGARVSAIMDIDEGRASAIAAECGGANVFTDASALINDANVDAIVIVSPDPTHAALTLECLTAQKPVLCEKPLATTMDDAQKVLDAEVALRRRLVQVGLMREYDLAHQAVKRAITQGDIGRPLMFRGVHNNLGLGSTRTTEDVIINSAIHDIHSARWMIGDEVERVYVQRVVAEESDPATCRFLCVQMTFRGGALATIELNADSNYGYEVFVEIVGEQGTIQSNSLESPILRKAGTSSQAVEPHWLDRFDPAYIREMQTWAQSVLNNTPTGPSVWDGYISLAIAEACIESAATGQPVTLPKTNPPNLYQQAST